MATAILKLSMDGLRVVARRVNSSKAHILKGSYMKTIFAIIAFYVVAQATNLSSALAEVTYQAMIG